MRETVRAVIVDQNHRTFLVQHRERNPADLGKWGNPGGGIDKSDKDHLQALTRELAEEFGAEIIGQIEIGAKLLVNHRPDRTDHFYTVRFFGSSISPQAPEEIMNFGWFTIDEAASLKLFFGFEAKLAAEATFF
ncbi:MAG: NUDIX hydrolase [Bdellovibrionales bacterium]|nr:NUDIX hydrolase [Bdellovibrionales bacterium]